MIFDMYPLGDWKNKHWIYKSEDIYTLSIKSEDVFKLQVYRHISDESTTWL